MMKKMVVGALVAVLVGGLAVGIWSMWSGSASAGDGERHGRSSQQEQDQGATGGRLGQGRQGEGGQGSDSQERGSTGRGQSSAGSLTSEASRTQGRGRGGAGQQGSDAGTAQPDPQAPVDEWLTYEGTAVKVDDFTITVATDAGEEIVLEMGPSWFLGDQDFVLAVGDEVSVTGFYDGDAFEVSSITRLSDGQSLELRGVDGRPVWAGGRGQGGRS
jgi:hypothetical protein